MSALQDQVRCELYKKLMDEHCTKPTSEVSAINYGLAKHFIEHNLPEDARFYVVRAGVPKDLVVAMDLLVADNY